MKTRKGAIVALLVLATCSEEARDSNSSPPTTAIESSHHDLGAIPATESAVWQKLGSSTTPDPRYLQAVAFDSARGVAVMFGGTNMSPNGGMVTPNQETWEWSTTTGKWTNRTGTGTTPDARSGAAMVYDSKRAKLVLFGGRAGSGYNYEDTWEWDPATGLWTDVTNAGSHPSARSQHGMAYEASTGKILLFGGGRSDSNSADGSGVVVSLGDTWELDPTTHVWTALSAAAAPAARHDFGLVWDSTRNKAVLFGGLQIDVSGVTGIPKQDTWEWDPSTATWTERTGAGSKPSPRYGHAMAFDGSRGKAVVFGGFAISTGGDLNDVWDWDPVSGGWTERMTGAESPMPTARQYASLVSDDSHARLELLAGATYYDPWGGGSGGRPILPPTAYGTTGSREVWELDPSKPAFTDRTVPLDIPQARVGHSMAYNPSTGNVYVFGGSDAMTGLLFDDLWAWDGKVWAQVAADTRPPARSDAALAFDPARKSLILYGGSTNNGTSSDTWEWTPAKGWTQLSPVTSPISLSGHGMVTDTTRNKILLFGGYSYSYVDPYPKSPMSSDVWEWDGAAMSWTDRGPTTTSNGAPSPRQYPLMAYDSGRQKLLVYDGTNYSSGMGVYWEWDPISAGWAMFDTGDRSESGYATAAAFDSIRRRQVLYVQGYNSTSGNSTDETWELDANSLTLYVRSIATPPMRYNATMAFDSARGVAVLFGGQLMNQGIVTNETWEYRVTGLGNGEGCTAASTSLCASGFCADGVCCEAAACTGPCKSCNVRGSEGKCVLVKAGTEVPGSCANGQACDGTGNCMTSNGQKCSTGSTCASGFCADGVCCDSACAGTCMACNQTGQVGKCTPFAAGTDPQKECGQGDGTCKSACDGVSGCGYPSTNVSCDKCMTCDGYGKCDSYDPYCWNYGGSGGGVYPTGGVGGYVYPTGGYVYPTGGYPITYGGAGGYIPPRAGAGGTIIIPIGGSAGYSTSRGGAGGVFIPTGGNVYGGSSGSVVPRGGAIGGSGGRGGTNLVGGSAGFGVSGGTTSRGGSIGFGGTPVGFGGVAGSSFASGGSIGQGGTTFAVGGAGGKADGGILTGTGGRRDAGSSDTGIDEIRLHRSGCFCVLGRTETGGTGLTVPLALGALALLLARSRRRKGR